MTLRYPLLAFVKGPLKVEDGGVEVWGGFVEVPVQVHSCQGTPDAIVFYSFLLIFFF